MSKGRLIGCLLGGAFAAVSGVAVFVASVGWHGEVSDWYEVPVAAWGVVCSTAGMLLGGRRV